MLDLLIKNATLADGRCGMSVAVRDGKIVEVAAALDAPANEVVDAQGMLLSPPFVDAHFHMDATLSYGLPRVNESGTLLEGIALWGELKPLLTQDALIARALTYCDWAVAKGLLAIRSHVDVCDPRLLAVEALLEVKRRVSPYLDLQLVAFPQDGVLRGAAGPDQHLNNLKRALDLGVDVIGGIPHFERTMADGGLSIKLLCELAAERGVPVDMHCDESDDPLSRHVETLAYETQRLGLHGRVTGSHLTSMHSMDNYYVSKLLPLIAETPAATSARHLAGWPASTSLMTGGQKSRGRTAWRRTGSASASTPDVAARLEKLGFGRGFYPSRAIREAASSRCRRIASMQGEKLPEKPSQSLTVAKNISAKFSASRQASPSTEADSEADGSVSTSAPPLRGANPMGRTS